MDRHTEDRYTYGGYERENRYSQERDNIPDRELRERFDREYRSRFDREDQNRRNQYQQRNEDADRFRNYRSHEDDSRGRGYARDFRGGQPNQGELRRGYGISDYDGTSDRYNTLNNPDNDRGRSAGGTYYSGDRDGFTGTRFGGGVGESFPHTDRGVPNYGTRNFSDSRGTGMGSTYGGANYGGGTGYMSGHRGGSFGNTTFGNSAGNYGGFGSMSGSGGSRVDRTSHNSDRSSMEYGGF